jgi:CheY-like chemotaxis protein
MKCGFTLLLADDDENDVTFFKTALEESSQKAGIPVRLVVTQDGEQALAYLKGEGEFGDRTKHPLPDIVVTDLKMPRLNGLAVLGWLKDQQEYQRIPKIMLSGSNEDCDVDEAYRLGANTFFQKPLSLKEFRDLVYHILCYWAHTHKAGDSAPKDLKTNATDAKWIGDGVEAAD